MPSAILAASRTAGGGSTVSVPWWIGFVGLIVGLLVVDLVVVDREAHVVSSREAARWSAIWISLGVAFAAVFWFLYPNQPHVAAQQYLSGYLIEKSLSVDNLFVFILIFSYFKVPDEYQHRVLFWGIFGALMFRGGFIAVGSVLLSRFSWVAYVFGAFLVITGARMATQGEIEVHPEHNPVLNLLRRLFRITDDFAGPHLFTRRNGVLWATPLLAVLVVIETTDVVFAVDSIPAIFGVTRDPFIVFTSNAFALLGLRALYFLLASAVRRFRYLDAGVATVLVLVGAKMIVEEAFGLHLPEWVPLAGIFVVLGSAIVGSLVVEHDGESQDEATRG